MNLPKDPSRFWSLVARDVFVDRCWLWTGRQRNRNGYGRTEVRGRRRVAHVVAYLLAGGTIPAGYVLRHRCDNRLCVNPCHLTPGTQQENVRDMHERGRNGTGGRFTAARNPARRHDSRVLLAVRALVALGVPPRRVAERFGVSERHVRRVAA